MINRPLVALGQVDDHLGLLEHLHGVGAGRDRLDGVGQVGRLVAGDRTGDGEDDQHEADGDHQAGREQLEVQPAVPRGGHGRQHAGTGAEGGGSLAQRHMMFPSSQLPTAGDP